MNAVQIIHKHIMLRFCVVLLAIFVAFGAFTSTCFADDPLGRQITVAVGGTIGSGLGSLAGGSIAAAGVSAVGLPAAAPIASKVGSGLVGSAGGVVGGMFAGKLYDFLTGYDGDANEESFETAYDSFIDSSGALVSESYNYNDYYYSFYYLSSFELFPGDSSPTLNFTFTAPVDGVYYTRGGSNIFIESTSYAWFYDSGKYAWGPKPTYDYYVDNFFKLSDRWSFFKAGQVTNRIDDTITSEFYHAFYNFFVILRTESDLFISQTDYRTGSASSGTSVAAAFINNIGSGNVTVGCIDASSPDKANNFYTLPLIDETENKLILPDGSVIDFDGMSYDYTKRTYSITYDTSKTYTITYNYNNCVVNDGSVENVYYYAKVDANIPAYDKDGNQINDSGGSTTDPSNPDTPSGGDDDNSGSIWDKVVDAIAGLFTAVGKVIGGLLESVINLFTGIVDGLTGCLDLFGSFGKFVAGFYTWMPEEWRTILASAFTIFIGLAVVKLFRGS